MVTTASAGKLYLDGKVMADIPAGANAKLDSVEVGERSLEIVYADGQEEQHTANVETGNVASVSFTYKKSPPMGIDDFEHLVAFGTLQQIQDAIHNGTDVNAHNSFGGWTPLMNAAHYRNLEVVTMLLKAGADINAVNNFGWTALMAAVAWNRDYEVITTLLEAGADATIKNNKGELPLAFTQNNTEIKCDSSDSI